MGDDSGPHAHIVNYRVGESITVELPSGETITHNTDIFSFLDSTLSDTNVRIPTEFPFDFTGGYVGYLGYELMAITEHVEGSGRLFSWRINDRCSQETDFRDLK